MNNPNKRREESGQILIILTVGVVALLAITALALDGGMIYSDRRYDQNAADASALAGGGSAAMYMENHHITYDDFSCNNFDNPTTPGILYPVNNDAVQSAVTRAASNNFTIDTDISDQHGVEIRCENEPALFGDRFLDVHVEISSTLQTAFAHMFYNGPVRNSVEATVRVYAPGDAGYGFALATLSDQCDEGLEFAGGGSNQSTIILTNSGAHSNSCIWRRGNVDVYSVPSPSFAAHPEDPLIPGRPEIVEVVSGGYHDIGGPGIGSGVMMPVPLDDPAVMPKIYLEERMGVDPISQICPPLYSYDDGHGPVEHSVTHGGTIEPMTYESIQVNGSEVLHMNPGLYCIQENFIGLGGTIEGDGVTIIILDGTIDIGGNVTVDLTAPSDPLVPFPHLLVYTAKGNDNSHNLLGNSTSLYQGSIYMPDAYVKIGGVEHGVGGPTYSTQVVAWSITVVGNATLNLAYDDTQIFTFGASLNMNK